MAQQFPGTNTRPTLHPSAAMKAAYHTFWRMEEECGLFERTIRDVRYWYLIRPSIFDALSAQLSMRSNAPRDTSWWHKRIKPELLALQHEVGNILKSPAGSFDTALLPFPRKQVRDGRVVDIHSEAILRDPQFGRIFIIDRAGPNGVYQPQAGHVVGSRGGFRLFAALRAAALVPDLMGRAAVEHGFLTASFQKYFGMSCPFAAHHIAMRTAFFHEGRAIGRGLLQRIGVRCVTLVGNHSISGIVAAARDLRLETIEAQHGALSAYQLGYHYPGHRPNPYMADRMLTFGSFWSCNLELPAGMTATVIGSDNMKKLESTKAAKVPRRVVAMSQIPTDWQFFDTIVAAARLAPGWTFHLRPHPWENIGLYRARLAAISPPDNFILNDPDTDLYGLLASAEVQVGVFSTSLFEGMKLGARTIVLDLPGAEVMEGVIQTGDAVLACGPDELVKILQAAPRASDCTKYYASPVASIAAAIAEQL